MTERRPVDDTLLSFALRAMLVQPHGLPSAEVEALTARLARVEDTRASPVLTPAERAQLIPLVLQWADQLRPDVGQVLRHAFGEETTETRWKETPWKPGEAPRGQRQQHLQETRAMILMSESPEVTSQNGMTLMSESTEARWAAVVAEAAATMESPPYNQPPSKLEKAKAVVLQHRVSATSTPGTCAVVGCKGTLYTVTEDGCSCKLGTTSQKTKYACYHAVSVVLQARALAFLHPSAPRLPLPPITIDERLAQPTPQETPMAAPQTDAYTPEPETATPPSPEAFKALRLQIIKQLNLYGFKGSSKLDYEEAV